jgi:hypothetical protein
VTENDLSNLPANIQIFPLKKFEFIAAIQIDQWERFPPKKIYRLILRTNRQFQPIGEKPCTCIFQIQNPSLLQQLAAAAAALG